MSAPIVIVTLIGVVTYLWLTTVALPVLSGLKSWVHASRGDGWRDALPLSLGIAGIATTVPTAAAILLSMWAPSVALHLIDSTWLTLGVQIGAGVWCARALVGGIPRLPVDLELALALAVVSLKTNDAARLSTAERLYHHYMLGTAGSRYGGEPLHAIS